VLKIVHKNMRSLY